MHMQILLPWWQNATHFSRNNLAYSKVIIIVNCVLHFSVNALIRPCLSFFFHKCCLIAYRRLVSINALVICNHAPASGEDGG